MNNIFENAYFGKPYMTNDGRKAILIRYFICNGFKYLLTTGNMEFSVDEYGKVDKRICPFGVDIVSEWQEEVNEEELDKLACEYSQGDALCRGVSEGYTCPGLIKAFKAGYKKAKKNETWNRRTSQCRKVNII